MRLHAEDLFYLGGLVLLSVGAWFVYWPAGLMTLGVGLMAFAVGTAWGKSQGD